MTTLKRNKDLAKKAEENTTIQKKTSGEVETLKSGTPLEHSSKHFSSPLPVVGMSKGVTKNMDNYESLRVDVWLSDSVQTNESAEQAMERIEAFIDKALETAIYNTIGE